VGVPIRVWTDDSQGAPDYPVLSVDLNALSDVAVALRQEVDGNLVRHITQLNAAYSMGVDFGSASHSDNVKQAREVYHDCLVQITALLSKYVQAGEVFATAIDEIVKQYGSSDAMAKARVDEVMAAIGAAENVDAARNLMAVEQFSGRAGSFE
jgi:hypothetical protein